MSVGRVESNENNEKKESTEKSKKLNKSQIEKWMNQAHIPGMSVATVIDGKISQQMALGQTGLIPQVDVNSETMFQAASLSKPLFAYLVLMISKEYGFNLDERLDKFLKHERIGVSGHANCEFLTARMILSHQSGLPGMDFGLERAFEFQYKPGEGYGYSGPAYYYLQQVLEKVTGKPLEQLAQELVFSKIGMKHSSFLPPHDKANIAQPHNEKGEPLIAKKKEAEDKKTTESAPKAFSANSLYTTATDYALFIEHWLKSQDELLQSAFKPAVSMTADQWALDEHTPKEDLQKISWGLGWALQETNQGTIAFHWGDMGDMKAFVAINLKDKSAIVYFANSHNGLSIAHEMISPIVGDDLTPGLNYLFKKFGYQRSTEPGWEDRQKRQTWINFAKHEVHDKLSYLAKLLNEKSLILDENSVLNILTIKGDPNLLFVRVIQYQFAEFKEKNSLQENKDFFVKSETNEDGKSISIAINIPNNKLYHAFIEELKENHLLIQPNIPQLTESQSAFNLIPQ